ncbi:MAG TPA: DUF4340 domain-containing protein [Candidatus Krumholzibacteria bacterium]|nr:DUF4340 domain-containing protein [Candidatus Krumholzibacteria bacterium]
MGSRRLLLLFLAATVAVAAYFLVELPRQRDKDQHRRDATRLFEFDAERVDTIILDRPDATLRFAITGTHWVMRSPLHDDAELASVVPLLSTLASAGVERDLGPGSEDARYGFDAPSARLTLLAGSDTVATLELGDYTVDRSFVYARRPDGHVLLVPTAIHRAAMLPVNDFRNRRVAVFDLAAVSAYTLDSRETGTSRWTRGPGDSWFTVAHGDTIAGDSVAVPAVLRRLRGLRVSRFVSDADTAMTGPALVTVSIRRLDGSLLRVHLFDHDGVARARVDGNPRVVEVADNPLDIARESFATLRDRRVLQFDPLRALRITVSTADTSAVLVRAGDAWALPNPSLGTLDPRRSADFVRTLRNLQFLRVVDTPLPTATPAAFSLVVYGAGDTILDELSASPAPGEPGIRLGRSRSLGRVCEIDTAAIDAIIAALRRIRH